MSIIPAACANQSVAAADRSAVQLAALCASCHRLDRPHGIPPIASLGEQQIVAMMRGFKARRIPGSLMHVVSNALSDTEIAAVAAHLARSTGKAER